MEDNELNAMLFCDLLRAHEYDPVAVRDGRDALDCARELMPDLIVMDIHLPHVTGYELIKLMKSDPQLRAIPIMAVTAYSGLKDEQLIRAAGAVGYVSKPISLIGFMEEIRSLI